jgi:hypothetical protein
MLNVANDPTRVTSKGRVHSHLHGDFPCVVWIYILLKLHESVIQIYIDDHVLSTHEQLRVDGAIPHIHV